MGEVKEPRCLKLNVQTAQKMDTTDVLAKNQVKIVVKLLCTFSDDDREKSEILLVLRHTILDENNQSRLLE